MRFRSFPPRLGRTRIGPAPQSDSEWVSNRFEEQARCDSGLSHRGWADQHNVFGFADKLEVREGADLLRVDARLAFERKRFEGPHLGEVRLFDPPRERRFLAMVILR